MSHFFGIGARSPAGMSLPLVSFSETFLGGGVWLLDMTLLSEGPRSSLCRLRWSLASIPAFSSSSESWLSSSTNSPSAVSTSGGVIHSRGTTHGRASPTLAARLSHAGAGFEVSFSQRYDVKWLQLLVRRL